MKDLNSRNKGIYIPSFFWMKIDSLTFGNSMTNRELSLFVHEYIHFLQSFTTLYGLERLNSDFTTLMSMVNWLKDNKEKDIQFPLSEDVLGEITRNNRFITQLTWGEQDTIFDRITILAIHKTDNPIIIDPQRCVEDIYLECKLQNGEEDMCSFGARDIIEGMAYIIEQHITTDFEISPDCPYNTAYKVAEFIYPEITDDYRNLIVLYDKALMSSHPACEFIDMLKWLKSIDYPISSPDDLYLFLGKNWETFNLDTKTEWLTVFKDKVSDVCHNLHMLLNDDYFASYHNWVDALFSYAVELRTNEPMFWLDIVDFGEVRTNTFFQAILHFAGGPLVETTKHEYYFIDPEGCHDSTCLVYMKVFHQIYRLLVEGNVLCSLMPWCNDPRNEAIVDSTCYKCPWKHSEHNGKLCTFKGIWQHWGLNNTKIYE